MTTTDERPVTAADFEQIVDRWAALRAPFEPKEIEKLPKALSKNDQDKGKCEPRSKYSADGHHCGGYHTRSIHLDYVGHAGVTMRLNQVCGTDGWSWEPMHRRIDPALIAALGSPVDPTVLRMVLDTMPIMQSDGGLWIRLTVMGHTKVGFGDAAGKTGPNATKELIGDAIRNAGMRFGIGTYLWSKSEAASASAIREHGAEFDADDDAYSPPVGSRSPVERQQARSQNRKLASSPPPSPAEAARLAAIDAVARAAEAAGVPLPTVAADWSRRFKGQDIRQATSLGDLELVRDELLARAGGAR